MLELDVPPLNRHFIEKRRTIWVRTCESEPERIIFTKHRSLLEAFTSFHFVSSRCFQFQEYGSAHRANVGNRHSREVQFQSVRATQNRARTSCATLALCSVPWDGTAPVPCSSQVSLKFTQEHVAFIKFLQSVNVTSKLLCTWSDVSGQFLLTLQAWVLSSRARPNIAAGGKSRRSAILLAQRRIMNSIAIGTIPALGVPLCSEFVSFLLTVPIPPRHCKGSTFLICSDPVPRAIFQFL